VPPQAFHTLFHTDESVLLGAPTGSGKTISSELTMMRLWEAHPGDKVRTRGCCCCCCYLWLLMSRCNHHATLSLAVVIEEHGASHALALLILPSRCRACIVTRQVIYIAPLKALVRERMADWGKGLCRRLGKRIVELTGAGLLMVGGEGRGGGACLVWYDAALCV
jgi:replicative superfamily II helicase